MTETNFAKLVIAASDAWDPGFTRPFDDLIRSGSEPVDVQLLVGEDVQRLQEFEYARGQVELILNACGSRMDDQGRIHVAGMVRSQIIANHTLSDGEIVDRLAELPWGGDEDINGGDLVDLVGRLLERRQK